MPENEVDTLPLRRITFHYPDDLDPAWIPDVPEFAYAANGLSLLMPYAEPLFIKAVRSAFPVIDDDMRARTENYIKQEVGHYSEHQRFNEIIRARHPGVGRVERWMKRCADWISTTRSRNFNLAFAAGGEIMSFLLARWVDKHAGDLFTGAEPVPTTLFLWHLAEEVEHKSSASDVYEVVERLEAALRVRDGPRHGVARMVRVGSRAGDVARRRTAVQPGQPLAVVPMVAEPGVRALPVDVGVGVARPPTVPTSPIPIFLTTWLRQYDPVTATMPLWETSDRTG